MPAVGDFAAMTRTGLRGMDLRSGADFRDLKIHADNVVF
jgi:hypothetical protein